MRLQTQHQRRLNLHGLLGLLRGSAAPHGAGGVRTEPAFPLPVRVVAPPVALQLVASASAKGTLGSLGVLPQNSHPLIAHSIHDLFFPS